MNVACPFIKQNEGTVDRIIRIAAGVTALFIGSMWFAGSMQTVLYAVGVVLLVTGAMGFCGLYALFGFTTKQNNTK